MSKQPVAKLVVSNLGFGDGKKPKPLIRGGGDGTYGDMEQRVGRIEIRMDKVEERLTSIEVILARIETKLDFKPGHWAVLALNATLVALVLAAIGFGASVLPLITGGVPTP